MERVSFGEGENILTQDEEGEHAFFVVSGRVGVFFERNGKETKVCELGDGEVFGEMSLIDPGPRSATVRALADTVCVRTSYDEFMQSVSTDPEVAIELMKTLVSRLREANRLISEQGGKGGLRERLKKLLETPDNLPPEAYPMWYGF